MLFINTPWRYLAFKEINNIFDKVFTNEFHKKVFGIFLAKQAYWNYISNLILFNYDI